MACQKVCKQGRDDIIVTGYKYTKPNPYIFYITVANWCENDAGPDDHEALYIYLHYYIIPTSFYIFNAF